jgi:hypothetical protein
MEGRVFIDPSVNYLRSNLVKTGYFTHAVLPQIKFPDQFPLEILAKESMLSKFR